MGRLLHPYPLACESFLRGRVGSRERERMKDTSHGFIEVVGIK